MFEQISLSWQPLVPLPLLLIWLTAGAGCIFWQWRTSGQAVRKSYRLALQGLRFLVLLLFFVFFCRPVIVRRQPEEGAFRMVVLADQSRSMEQVDLQKSGTRMDRLGEFLQKKAVRRILSAPETELQGFSEELRPLGAPAGDSGGRLPVLPGPTCLGEVLDQAVRGQLGSRPLGAVLLCSDGRWNEGRSPVEVAKELALRDIPVSCVGIGAAGTPADVRVRFIGDMARSAEKNRPYQVEAEVRNDFDHVQELEVELLENNQRAGRQTVRVQPRSSSRVSWMHHSLLAGMRSLCVRVTVPPGDLKRENNLDFQAVEIREADRFRILYLGNAMHWEWRFLNINAGENEQLRLAAVIRTGEKQFFHWGLSEEAGKGLKGFPEDTRIYREFDAVLAEADVLWQLSPAGAAALTAFVEYKGGGLLITGRDSTRKQLLPEAFRGLCPVSGAEPARTSALRFMTVPDDMVFRQDAAGILHSARGIPLYAGLPVLLGTGIRKAARVLVQMPDGRPVLTAQSYGAGRCAYLGLQETWQWRMRGEAELYEAFWNQLLVWLASCQTPQLEVLEQNCRVPVDVLHDLRLRVSGTDFLPAPDARVTASVTDPAGRISEIVLHPALDEIGLYVAGFRPDQPGEYVFRYSVKLPDDKVRQVTASLLAVLSGREVQNMEYHEEMLRDIARITGGKFFTPEDFNRSRINLPLSGKLPMTETGVPLLYSWWMLLLLTGICAFYWWLRRRIGLK